MQIAREEPFGSLQKEADIFCLKFTLNSLILSWIKMRHFFGFINSVYDSWHIRKMHENLMKNTNRKVVDHVFKNTLKCAADKNKETKAAPKLRRQARWVYNPRKNSKWVENGLTAAKLRRSWAFWAIVMEKTIRHTWQLQLELLHFQFRDRMRDFSECGWWHDTLEKSLPSWT